MYIQHKRIYAYPEPGNSNWCDMQYVLFAGPPLPPSLQYSVIDETSLLVFWEEPYTAHDFPITGYFLHVDANQMGETVLADVVLSPDIQNYTVTQVDATLCSNLTFHISAQNSVGNSSVDTTFGAFLSGEFIMMSTLALSLGVH